MIFITLKKYVIGRLAMLVQGLRSHPLHQIYHMDFATASRVGDGFTASPPNQPWVRDDDKQAVLANPYPELTLIYVAIVIGALAV